MADPSMGCKILHVIPTLEAGGASRSAMEICMNLPAGFTPAFYTPWAKSAEYVAELRGAGIEVVWLTNGPGRRPAWPIVLGHLARAVRRLRPDIVHTHNMRATILGHIVAQMYGIPAVGHLRTVHDYEGTWLQRMETTYTHRFFHRRGSVFLACGDDIAEEFRRQTGVEARVVQNAIPIEKFAQARRTGKLRRELGLGENACIVGSAGRLAAQKNFACLLRAARRVVDTLPDVHFVVAGDGPLREELDGFRLELGLDGKVHFLGWRSNLPEMMREFDIFILPSRYEGLARVVIEAMASGLPVVGSDVTGVRESIVNNMTGYVVEPDDDREFAARIIELAQGKDLRARMGALGQQRARTRFSLQRLIAELTQIYSDMLRT